MRGSLNGGTKSNHVVAISSGRMNEDVNVEYVAFMKGLQEDDRRQRIHMMDDSKNGELMAELRHIELHHGS